MSVFEKIPQQIIINYFLMETSNKLNHNTRVNYELHETIFYMQMSKQIINKLLFNINF